VSAKNANYPGQRGNAREENSRGRFTEGLALAAYADKADPLSAERGYLAGDYLVAQTIGSGYSWDPDLARARCRWPFGGVPT
jgi:hypothetical protein